MGRGSNPADDDMSENDNTTFAGFVSANHSFFNSINSNSRPGVPIGNTTFTAPLTNNNNSNTNRIQPNFGFPLSNSNPSGPSFGDSIRMTLSSSSSPSLFADVAKPSFVESTRTTSSSPFPSLFADGTKPISSSSSSPSLFTDGIKPFQFNNPFNSTSTPSSLVHVCYNCGYNSFWGQHWGSKAATYTPTPTPVDIVIPASYFSISAMPFYKDKSHEELRFEDYRFQAKKQKLVNAPINESAPFGQTSNNVPVNYESTSAPFGQPTSSLPVLMLPLAVLPITANFHP